MAERRTGHGCQCNQQQAMDITFWVANSGQLYIVHWLTIQARANVGHMDTKGKTALDVVITSNKTLVADYFLLNWPKSHTG